MALYHIVEFPDESVAIVSSKWLNEDSTMTRWPSDSTKIKSALLMHEVPGQTWTAHQIEILTTAGTFLFSSRFVRKST